MTAVLALDPMTFVEPIQRAVGNDRVTELAETLARLTIDGAFDSPEIFAPGRQERYSRRLLWRDPAGFVVLSMTWVPGQGSPLHDHDGLWGAEIVVSGTMRETPYRLLDRDRDGRCRFAREEDSLHGRGSVGAIVAPREYHEFENAGLSVAHTIHVYSGEIQRCTTYAAEGDGWWRGKSVSLGYDV